MQFITITEFRRHFEKYLELCQKDDIVITIYGKPRILVIGLLREQAGQQEEIEADETDQGYVDALARLKRLHYNM